MANVVEVKVPDIGDFKNVPVIEVLVKAGDTVNAEDPLVTLESDKATMEVPAPGDGISIVALSDSSVTSDCSFAILSPGLTRISMTSTFLKSPMSGTFTSELGTRGSACGCRRGPRRGTW